MLARLTGVVYLAVGLASAGCMTNLAAGTTVKVIAKASPAIQRYEDPDLAAEGIPGSIATMEGLLEIRPDDTFLREILARTYASYGFGFMEDRMEDAVTKDDEAGIEHYRKRAGMAYRRARELALGSLTIWNDDGGGAEAQIKAGLPAFTAYASDFDDKDQAPTLFWGAYAWARYIGLNRDDVNALADLPYVTVLVDRLMKIDPTYMGHAPHALRAGLIGTAPAQLGGRPAEAKKEFEIAIAATKGRNLMYLVMEANIVAVALQDRALYKKLLTTALDAPTDIDKDNRLSNQLAKRRAARYLADIDRLFEPEAPPAVETPAPAAPPAPAAAAAKPAAPPAPAPSAAKPAAPPATAKPAVPPAAAKPAAPPAAAKPVAPPAAAKPAAPPAAKPAAPPAPAATVPAPAKKP